MVEWRWFTIYGDESWRRDTHGYNEGISPATSLSEAERTLLPSHNETICNASTSAARASNTSTEAGSASFGAGFPATLALSAFCAIKLLVRCWFLHRRHPRCNYWRDHYCRHRHHCCRCHHRPLFPRTSDLVRPRQYRRGNIRPRTIRRSAL